MGAPRFEPMMVELSFTRDLPWRVYDNTENRALKSANGRPMRFQTEDEALRVAMLMNERANKGQ